MTKHDSYLINQHPQLLIDWTESGTIEGICAKENKGCIGMKSSEDEMLTTSSEWHYHP